MTKKLRRLLVFLLTVTLIVGVIVPAAFAREDLPVRVDAGRDVWVTVILRVDPDDDDRDRDHSVNIRATRRHDPVFFRDHNDLVEIIDIEIVTRDVSTRGATVEIHRDRRMYVYNAQRQFVGTTNQTLNFSTRFFIARAPIDFGTTAAVPRTPPTPQSPTATSNIQPAAARGLVEQAIRAAGPDTVPSIRITNPGIMSLATFQEINRAAQGRDIAINADSLDLLDGTVDVRVRLNPALVTTDLFLYASTTSPNAVAVRTLFDRYFNQRVSVISFGQLGSFGMDVQIAAAVPVPAGFDLTNLRFYSYNRTENTFRNFTPSGVRVDRNGFLHFTTSTAGYVIIATSPLTLR